MFPNVPQMQTLQEEASHILTAATTHTGAQDSAYRKDEKVLLPPRGERGKKNPRVSMWRRNKLCLPVNPPREEEGAFFVLAEQRNKSVSKQNEKL